MGGQLTNSLAYRFSSDLALVFATQIGFYEGLPVDVGEFRSETDVSQQILKNGLQLVKSFDGAFVDAGVTHTQFLQDAVIDHYFSPNVGIGLRFGKASGVRLAYQADLGDSYTAHTGLVQIFFHY